MSYAAVTAHNAAPLSQQPHPDLGLLNTSNPKDETIPNVDKAKVTVVAHDFNEHPMTNTIAVEHTDSSSDDEHRNLPGSQKRHARKDKDRARKRERERQVRKVERKVEGWVDWTKNTLFRPEVAGGVFAVVNIGVLGTLGYNIYKRPSLVTEPRMNAKPLAVIGTGLISLFAFEGWAAEAYLETPQGQEELRRAEEEGHYLFNKTREVVLRPKVAGGLLGITNLAVLSGLGYLTYLHWDSKAFTKKNISIATVGLITWFSAQGWVVEKYKQEDLGHKYGEGEKYADKSFTERLDAERVERAVGRLEKKKKGHGA